MQHSEKFKINEKHLDLQQNREGIYICKGRIDGAYPIYLPNESLLLQKIIFTLHKNTLHGGVLMTMKNARSTFWIPSLRQLTKSIIRNCYGYQRHYVVPYPQPKPGLLPKEKSKAAIPSQAIGTGYAGPIYYQTKSKKESKAYILLFSCNLSRAMHFELTPNLTTNEFIKCFKLLIAPRGRPKTVYSDNTKTFQAAAKWLNR